jgi:hypothetical protein
MPPTPRLDRRRFVAGGAVALLAGLAGCSGDSGQGVGDPVSNVPAIAGVLVDADAALVEHEGSRRLLAAVGDEDRDLVSSFEARTGLDADMADRVLLFSAAPGSRERAVVVEGEWSEAAVVDAAESARETTYESSEHAGGTVYEPVGGADASGGSETTTATAVATGSADGAGSDRGDTTGSADGAGTDRGDATGSDPAALLTVESLGVVTEGRYVFGDEASVEASLDAAYGETDSVGGALLDALESADVDVDGETKTYVTAATDAPRAYLPADDELRLPPGVSLDPYELAETANAAYAADGSRVALEATLHVVDEDAAVRLEDLTVSGTVFLRNGVGDDVAAELEKVSVERDGTVVTITYRSTVDGAITLVEWAT